MKLHLISFAFGRPARLTGRSFRNYRSTSTLRATVSGEQCLNLNLVIYIKSLYDRLTTLLKIRKTMGLERTRKQGHTVETIRDAMLALRDTYPNAGAREMVSLLYHEREMSVAR
jgi:hypothetical protein